MGSGAIDRGFTGGLNKPMSAPSPQLRSLKEVTQRGTSSSKNEDNYEQLMVGSNVSHDKFGKGKVLKIEGAGPDKKATIFFPQHGSKTVLLRFANLQIIED
jgi:DNA helicase-2/ATP-dependent DNA helicase PcrA